MNYYAKETKLGYITIYSDENCISELKFENKPGGKPTALINKAFKEIEEYFLGKRKNFNLPLNPQGTEFQKQVWKELTKIPYGELRTYKDIAVACGNPKACRAVGMANNKNPICIIIPCHRVIGSNGALTGYSGGLEIKERLIQLESNFIIH